ncbi:L-threonate dehydrogenase [Seminavis robusta]|uniref:L-threonate dehydrogenase n=1 Tax=Seminavis robusta TaxID=568900 RepID=A0A9N8DN19_9STRA|nr:L-threonate dehydrogenase [Seminavis robusta]|eukprot:Sro236_g094870.1 L-threonate dehydrogenase (569) ;mRNA; r:6048-8073
MANVTVIGLGAMGGGMARALVDSPVTKMVAGFDMNKTHLENFYNDAKAANKAPSQMPNSQKESITAGTDFCILALVNEKQCEAVCFGGDDPLINSLAKDSCVILTSTVTATWARKACEKFQAKGIFMMDCPMSGGPARAREGALTMMASGDDASFAKAKDIINALGKEVYCIKGGAGMGSTVKMVHQLLAGVHICAAAEALSLAAKAGLDVHQMYDIVNGAAGASWMFQNRGERMLQAGDPEVKSALDIFVKDLDIVHAEAKALQSPIPIASSALQQFVSGQALGLGKKDDSQVVKVYESITGAPVGGEEPSTRNEKTIGEAVGEYWEVADGKLEEIKEVGEEPRHKVVLANEFVRALRVSFPPNDTTLAHRHAEDSLYFFLVEGGLDVVNHVQGADPSCDCLGFGEVRFGTHKSDKPLVHKITNKSNQVMLCIDAEVLKQPPITAAIPLVAEHHELIKTRDKCRVYKMTLEPGGSVEVTYPFFYFTVVLEGGTLQSEITANKGVPSISWKTPMQRGDVHWKEPVAGLKQTNVGASTFVMYIAEWRDPVAFHLLSLREGSRCPPDPPW